jgi:hypothetical protein
MGALVENYISKPPESPECLRILQYYYSSTSERIDMATPLKVNGTVYDISVTNACQ